VRKTFASVTLMKLHFHSFRLWSGLLLAALAAQSALAADPATGASDKTPADAPAAPTNVVEEIPQSVFVVSSPTQMIKDPFFPNSTRLVAMAQPNPKKGTNKVTTVMADLTLKAIFGTPDRPMATVNDATFEVGEEREVVTSSGRVRVRCIDIRLDDEAVIVEVAGSHRELRFTRWK